MKRRNFTHSLGFMALAGATGLSAAPHSKDFLLKGACSAYSRENLSALVGTKFACENHPSSLYLTALNEEKHEEQFHVMFRTQGNEAALTEKIYFLKSNRAGAIPLHMSPVEQDDGSIMLMATLNHAKE